MRVWHDRSHLGELDGEYISRGYAEDDIFSVRITFEYSEEQLQENRRAQKKMSPEQWAVGCDEAMQRRSAYIFPVMEAIAKAFVCYQYDREYEPKFDSPDWELFFWCNDFSNTANGRLSGRDYSYTRLNFNDHHDTGKHKELCNRLLLFLTEHFSKLDNLSVAVQHRTRFFEEKIGQEAKELAKRFGGMKYRYRNMDGSLFCTESGLIFMKKRARSHRSQNNRALKNGARLLYVYHTAAKVKFWIITEADRSATTVLLPSDY